jgi:DNA-directed RNA polymerase specialized sigma24 family protein
MSACHYPATPDTSDCAYGLPTDLGCFYVRLCEVLLGNRPDLCLTERGWLRAFNDVATRFTDAVSIDDSYWLSFEALQKCHRKGKARYGNYVLRACHRKHLDYVKRRKRTYPLPLDLCGPADHQARVDLRLDVEDALKKLGAMNERWETAVRMRLDGYTHGEIAAGLGVSERQALRINREALDYLRCLLASYADETRCAVPERRRMAA